MTLHDTTLKLIQCGVALSSLFQAPFWRSIIVYSVRKTTNSMSRWMQN